MTELSANVSREAAIGAVSAGLGTVANSCRYATTIQTVAGIGQKTLIAREIYNGADSVANGVEKLTDDDPTNNNSGTLEIVLGVLQVRGGVTAMKAAVLGKPSCFTGETPVATPAGPRRIDCLQEGDAVWAFDFEARAWRACRILETYGFPYNRDLVEVTADGEIIESTVGHPFWVIEGEDLDDRPRPEHIALATEGQTKVPGRWVDSHDLRIGDLLLLKDAKPARVTALERRHLSGTVYNIAIDELHCYAVGPSQALVHNMCAMAAADEGMPTAKGKQASSIGRTNAQLVQDVATRAETKIGGTGRLAGIDKHAYARNLIDRYQAMFGPRGLQTEVSVINGNKVPYGTSGSVSLDVLEGSVRNPNAIYDYKFYKAGTRGLSQWRINQIQNLGGYPGLPVLEVNP